MLFEEIDILDVSDKELQRVIEANIRKAAATRGQIARLREQAKQDKIIDDLDVSDVDSVEDLVEENSENDEFEDQVTFYLELISGLDRDFTEEELLDILPSRNNYYYSDIIKRLIAESAKEIKEYTELLLVDDSLNGEDLAECKKLIEHEKRKMRLLQQSLFVSEDVVVEKPHKNKIVLVPTSYGNIRIINELEHIPSEYYEGFLELINSIVDGSFKNVKQFKRKEFNGICEVKDFKIRVVFARLTHDAYALITAFMKKFDTDKLYTESLVNKTSEYKRMESSLRRKLEDPEFIEMNDENVLELFRVLGASEKTIEYIKGGKND